MGLQASSSYHPVHTAYIDFKTHPSSENLEKVITCLDRPTLGYRSKEFEGIVCDLFTQVRTITFRNEVSHRALIDRLSMLALREPTPRVAQALVDTLFDRQALGILREQVSVQLQRAIRSEEAKVPLTDAIFTRLTGTLNPGIFGAAREKVAGRPLGEAESYGITAVHKILERADEGVRLKAQLLTLGSRKLQKEAPTTWVAVAVENRHQIFTLPKEHQAMHLELFNTFVDGLLFIADKIAKDETTRSLKPIEFTESYQDFCDLFAGVLGRIHPEQMNDNHKFPRFYRKLGEELAAINWSTRKERYNLNSRDRLYVDIGVLSATGRYLEGETDHQLSKTLVSIARDVRTSGRTKERLLRVRNKIGAPA